LISSKHRAKPPQIQANERMIRKAIRRFAAYLKISKQGMSGLLTEA
jgi:hypothetical protein